MAVTGTASGRPGIDQALAPRSGVARDGQPLSYSRAPCARLSPWVARLYATAVDAPPDHRIDCGILNHTAMHRIQLAGEWHAQTRDGMFTYGRAALFFGPNTRLMPISVTGSFISIGVAWRAGACTVLGITPAEDYVDRMVDIARIGMDADALLDSLDPSTSAETWFQVLEDFLWGCVEARGGMPPDEIATRFEHISFINPTLGIAEIAEACGVDRRKLERVVRRDFGMAPRQVLRRARALDMASHLRGVADVEESSEHALRYYDQSHLIREFSDLFGMSPRQFVERPQPILTLALETRQARRLEETERLAPGAKRPWQ